MHFERQIMNVIAIDIGNTNINIAITGEISMETLKKQALSTQEPEPIRTRRENGKLCEDGVTDGI